MANIKNTNANPPTRMQLFVKKVKKYLYVTLAVLVLILGIYIYWAFFFTFSDGTRTGLLQKFSRKGTIFKTYEGELILSSVQSNKNVAIASEKFLFSVTDEDVALQLEKLQGKIVDVSYKEKIHTLPWRGETVFLVNSAKPNQ
jgi:hypothetical protein